MILFFVIGIALLALSTGLFVRAYAMNRMRAVENLGTIELYGYAHHDAADPDAPAVWRELFDGVAGAIGSVVSTRFGGGEAAVRKQLMAAGIYNLSPRKFMGYRVLTMVGWSGGWLFLNSIGVVGGGLAVLGFLGAILGGWLAPVRLVRWKAKRRLKEIERELPELIDLLVVTVEAGVGFTASLRMAAERLRGPIGEELRLMLQEQSMGLSSNEALRNLQERCDTPSTRAFVRSVLQGETLGVSIGQIMRNLALEMRKRRKAAAEERAQKAPVKILFPLIFLIFPAMFVVILGPVYFELKEVFG